MTLRLLVAGDGPQRAALAEQAAGLGIGGVVRFLGMCSDPAPVYAAADVFALPSQEEGLPNALLEAMASARAVVASAVGGVPAIVEHERTGLLVAPCDPDALAAALARLAADPPLRERLGHAARRYVAQHHSLSAMIDAHAALYRQVLERRR
jgi:glycosyltransferase involved in cell wall biosynthesis